MTTHTLTHDVDHAALPSFLAQHRAVPSGVVFPLVATATRAAMWLGGFRVELEGVEHLPKRPALLCTNSTQRYDFLALMKAVDQLPRGQVRRVVSVSKAKNHQRPSLATLVMSRCGTVPLASRGWFIAADFVERHGRKPSASEYRALRDVVDANGGASSVAGVLNEAYAARIERAFLDGTRASIALAREAVDAGHHVHIYPEGTVSPRLGRGRSGAVQLAHALALPVVPVGMSGCPDAFAGPVPKRGTVVVRFGAPLEVALPPSHRAFVKEDERANAAQLEAHTTRLMDAIEALLDERYRRDPRARATSKGADAHV